MKKFTVALIQQRSKKLDQAANTEQGIASVREAKRAGADLVLFPECWITSYGGPALNGALPPVETLDTDPAFRTWCDAALTEESEPLKRFRAAAAELSVGIVITCFTKGVKYPQNSAFVIGRDGSILMKYSKVHTCDFDWEQYLESGSRFPVCRFDDICLGVMICYDREYPESARELMLQGAELILVPNDCDNMQPRLRELSVRAMENMTGIAMANPPGPRAGRSCAYSPVAWDRDDNTILLGAEETEGILYASFDLDEIRAYRHEEDLGKFRKVGAYRHLLQNNPPPSDRESVPLQIEQWMALYIAKMQETFSGRISFIGLQGSRGRGEAMADSDIDAVLILDDMTAADLQRYRNALRQLPRSALACGFFSDRQTLAAWDRADLFQFYYDTTPYLGTLDFLQPLPGREDARRAAHRGVCTIFHGCVHNRIHTASNAVLADLYKAATFVLRAEYFCKTGAYLRSSAELLSRLPAEEAALLRTALRLRRNPDISAEEFGHLSAALYEWSYAQLSGETPAYFQTEENSKSLT